MSGVAQVFLMGNLTRDPETREAGGSNLTTFSVAVNERYKASSGEQRERVSYFDCKAWNRTGETIAQWFSKGKPIVVIGKLVQETWDKEGEGRSKIVVVVDSFSFVPGGNGGQGSGGQGGTEAAPPRAKGKSKSPDRGGEYEHISPDDIPF